LSESLRILYVGTRSGTCRQRGRALEALGHELHYVESGPPPADEWLRFQLYRVGHHLYRPPDLHGTAAAVARACEQKPPDLLWVDRGREVGPDLLERARGLVPGLRVVSYSPDDMMQRFHGSRHYDAAIPLYDLHVTTKSYNVPELRAKGARDVLFIDNAYDPDTHHPIALDDAERARFGCDVGFVGYYEEDRGRWMLRLAEAGVKVVIRGPAWNRCPFDHPNLEIDTTFLEGLDYTRVLCATRINLGFLRKGARDLQTTRSIEIPACGAFMLAERTDEHRALFEEGVEAEFFEDFDELLAKCRHYLADEDARLAVAAAGLRRCRHDRYDNEGRLQQVLAHLAA
jgi:spore maturation protein CgeB